MGGTAANRITAGGSGITGTALGAAGGAETHTLATSQIPVHTHANVLSDPGHSHGVNGTTGGVTASHTHAFSGATSSDGAHTHADNNGLVGLRASGGNLTFAGGGILVTGNINLSSDGSHTHTVSGATGNDQQDHAHPFSTTSGGSGTGASVINVPAGGGLAHNNMPPTMMVNFIMRVL
jgi:microcystin-dependent protein